MLRQLRRVLLQPPLVVLLQRLRDLVVHAQPARRDHLFVERLPEEGVREPVAGLPPALHVLDQRDAHRLFEGGHQLVFRDAAHPLQHVHREVAADYGRDAEDAVARPR